ncbi:MAG: rhodanese-like domain-containing protein [Bacteroidota bacterium]
MTTSITPKNLEDLRVKNKALVMIDVRERWEYEEENIGAINIPLCTIPSQLAELEKYRNSQIVCHCKTGKRSHQAVKFLKKNGFKSVVSLEGGLKAYLSQSSTVPG